MFFYLQRRSSSIDSVTAENIFGVSLSFDDRLLQALDKAITFRAHDDSPSPVPVRSKPESKPERPLQPRAPSAAVPRPGKPTAPSAAIAAVPTAPSAAVAAVVCKESLVC